MNLILGTAALGQRYGVANRNLNTSKGDAYSLLSEAYDLGIRTLDTAPGYGNSEAIIGNFHAKNHKYMIHTKIPGSIEQNPEAILSSIQNSVNTMRIEQIETLYFHSPKMMISENADLIDEILEVIRNCGLVRNIGVSIYTETELETISKLWPQVTHFQVPENILDQRLIYSNLMTTLSESGKIFLVRSIFLQGLLLMEPQNVPSSLVEATKYLEAVREFAHSKEVTIVDVALNYFSNLKWASGLVIGATSKNQLLEILNHKSFQMYGDDLPLAMPYPLIDPRSWE